MGYESGGEEGGRGDGEEGLEGSEALAEAAESPSTLAKQLQGKAWSL